MHNYSIYATIFGILFGVIAACYGVRYPELLIHFAAGGGFGAVIGISISYISKKLNKYDKQRAIIKKYDKILTDKIPKPIKILFFILPLCVLNIFMFVCGIISMSIGIFCIVISINPFDIVKMIVGLFAFILSLYIFGRVYKEIKKAIKEKV